MLSHLGNPLLTRANGRPAPYPGDRTILQIFESRAAARPGLPAVTYGQRTLSYGELDSLAAALACQLRERGVAKGDFIPLIMDGGLALPVAMIAAMKAAAPFVPVDSAWPAERVRAIIGQLRPPLALVSGAAVSGMAVSGAAESAAAPGVPALHVDLARLAGLPAPAPLPPASTAEVIYGFFTSGSTGTPKCTVNRHLGLLNRFLYMTRRFGGDQVVLQNSQHVFDSSVWQLLWPLINGSRVIIPERDGILDLARTIDIIAQHQVTMTDFVPSIFNTLVELLADDSRLVSRLSSLRRILIGGEEVSPAAVHTLRGLLPDLAITNTYGPTEASIGSVFHEITDADRQSIPIGLPIDNTYAVVVTERGELARPGEHGEIRIGGDCLGLGYLRDPVKTALAFVPNPFPQIPGTLLYRTGDLGYQREDGLFMFVGRTDQQVKLGGVRIELSEVETVLAAHPAVREAKVIVHDSGAARMLVGFAVTRAEVGADELLSHARGLLPASSVPRRIVLLDRLPLTHNGKADRRELSRMAIRLTDGAAAGAAAPPVSGTQAAVRDIWRELLSRDEVGVTESFFDAGGDSLAAQRLVLALEKRLGVRLSVRDIVGAPTIAGQAALADGTAREMPGARQVAAALRRDVRLDPAIARRGPAPRRAGPRDNGLGRVLLTGATGFVGAHLLAELAGRVAVPVRCLVRGGSREQAAARLADALHGYALPASAILSQAEVIPGDLELPGLGLSAADFAALAAGTDTLIHNAARVNLVLDYARHRAANVTGTAEILRLAAAGPATCLHYISTLSVFPAGPARRPGPLAAEHEAWELTVPPDGYSQSKWVAEKLIALARERGIPATVYRLGEVMPHSRTGIASPQSLLDGLLHACARLGLRFPTDAVTDWTPVDKVAEFIARAAASGLELPEYLHVLQPAGIRVDAVLDRLAAVVPLREVPYAEFLAALTEAAGRDRRMASLLSVLPGASGASGPPGPERLPGVFTDAAALFAADRAACLADDLGLPWTGEPALGVYPRPGAYSRRDGSAAVVRQW